MLRFLLVGFFKCNRQHQVIKCNNYQNIENGGSVKFDKLHVFGLIESFPHRLLFL